MVREFSAGGVVVRHMQGRWWIAVIEPEGRKGSGKKPVLALPKGLVDGREKPEQAAVREVREETGLEAALVTKLRDIRYVYVRSWGDGEKVFKIVSFYMLSYRGGNIDEISAEMRVEVRRALWVPLEEAGQQLAYRGEREVVQRAQEYVAAHPEMTSHA